MDVAIIGTGNVGSALATSSVGAGHTVTISSRDPQNAEAAGNQTGARWANTNREAVEAAEAVVLAVPMAAIEEVLQDLGDALDGKIVIDVTNRLNMENPGAVMDGTSNAEQIQTRAPRARVVKAFNTTFASRHADPVVDGVPVDMLVATDDDDARAKVMELVGSLGFRPIDAGSLVMARALEAMGLLNILLQIRHGWPWQTGWKLVGPTEASA